VTLAGPVADDLLGPAEHQVEVDQPLAAAVRVLDEKVERFSLNARQTTLDVG
jgi:hypothetical protein